MTTDNNQELATNTDKPTLSPQQLGALITNSGRSPIASLSEQERKALVSRVLDQYLEDGHLRDIAQSVGVSRTGLNWAIIKYAPEDWQSAQAARALYELDDAQEAMESASDAIAVGRAREQVKAAQWRLEKTCRRLYGDITPDRGGSGTININIGIERNATVTYEHDEK
jgi:hypothetical protein